MDLIKAKSILGRLQAMQQSLESDGTISTLERDLILNYLRELYTIYQDASVEKVVMHNPLKSLPEKSVEMPSQKTLDFKFEAPATIQENNYESLLSSDSDNIVPQAAELVHEKNVEPIEIKPEVEVKPTQEIKSEPITPVMPSSATHSVLIPVSIKELFEIKKGNELTDKLNELPLRDIHRGLGLNDKLEYLTTLFGNNKSLFDQIITELNGLRSFDEAQIVLGSGPAIQYKWDHEDRKDKAIEFIKLIRRRYL